MKRRPDPRRAESTPAPIFSVTCTEAAKDSWRWHRSCVLDAHARAGLAVRLVKEFATKHTAVDGGDELTRFMAPVSHIDQRRKGVGTDKLRKATGAVAIVVALIAAALLLGPGNASATQAIVDADTYVSNTSQTVNSNYGQVNNLPLTPTTRNYVRFDFSTLPPGTTGTNVSKATLVLFLNN